MKKHVIYVQKNHVGFLYKDRVFCTKIEVYLHILLAYNF